MTPASAEEVERLLELRERIQDLGMSDEDLENKNLVRFLRARTDNLDAAELMIRKNRAWYDTEDMKGILTDYKCPKGWEKDFYYAVTGVDNTGCLIVVGLFGRWDVHKATSLGQKEDFVKFCCHAMEQLWTITRKRSKEEDHMKQVIGLVDLSGFTVRQLSIDVVDACIRIVKAFEGNYPECVRAIVLINAPWTFQWIWKLLSPFLSERTHDKLVFLGSNKQQNRAVISKYADPDQFPESFGGDLPDSYRVFLSSYGMMYGTSENQNESEEESDDDNRIRISPLS